jgi:hypothetical protein
MMLNVFERGEAMLGEYLCRREMSPACRAGLVPRALR